MKLEDLGQLILKKRGPQGIRAAASEIGISPTTLSKVEHGHIPDQITLQKICAWIGKDVSKFTALGGLQIAFKKDQTLKPKTAGSLAILIQRAEEQFKRKLDRPPEH